METIIFIDIGIKNTGIAVFDLENKLLIDFYLISLKNLNIFIDEMTWFNEKYNIKMVIIEKQMKKNYKACALESQLLLWFKLKNTTTKLFPAKNKYINCNKSIYNTKYKRKKWAIDIVKTFINQNNLKTKWIKIKKKDDIADAILMGLIFLKIQFFGGENAGDTGLYVGDVPDVDIV